MQVRASVAILLDAFVGKRPLPWETPAALLGSDVQDRQQSVSFEEVPRRLGSSSYLTVSPHKSAVASSFEGTEEDPLPSLNQSLPKITDSAG